MSEENPEYYKNVFKSKSDNNFINELLDVLDEISVFDDNFHIHNICGVWWILSPENKINMPLNRFLETHLKAPNSKDTL